jgi:predicted N-formylglutamate amidohydrolase
MHAEPRALPHVLFEVRNDMLDSREQVANWAGLLAPALLAFDPDKQDC